MYNNPTEFIVYRGNTMVNKTVKSDMCVPIWNNYCEQGIPTLPACTRAACED